jgi:hypothetical protein
MSLKAQEYLFNEITRVIQYSIDEYNITWSEIVGCMYMILHQSAENCINKADGEQEQIEESDDESEDWKKTKKK